MLEFSMTDRLDIKGTLLNGQTTRKCLVVYGIRKARSLNWWKDSWRSTIGSATDL